ncbi:MAG: hypothetical protein QHH02_07680 [Syntrophomonadaceae bacterium]|nr:hypothetical protein [Syntrophomonadaceae bacterium]
MFVLAAFDHSYHLELAITDLEKRGIQRKNIGAVPLDIKKEPPRLLDTLHRADGISLFDGAVILGTVFMILGAIYGFVLRWGPIIWGLIGLFAGAALGFALDSLLGRVQHRNRAKRAAGRSPEVVLIIRCQQREYEMVERVLWDNQALGVGIFKLGR